MKTPIAIKDFGLDSRGIRTVLEVWSFSVNARNEHVIIEFDEIKKAEDDEVLSVHKRIYERFNKKEKVKITQVLVSPAVLYEVGEEISDGVFATGVEIKTPAVYDNITEVITVGNMKFDALRASPVGQMLKGMFELDLSVIQSISTIKEDLTQL